MEVDEVDQSEGRPRRLSIRSSFDALRHPNFARFWCGALISAVGTWMQAISVPYVIYQITESATWVGVATAADFLPVTLLSPYGAYVSDRFDRRHVLIVSQWVLALSAFVLAAVWAMGWRSPVLILLPVITAGVVTGLDLPSWSSFVNQLVPREDLMSAVSLNSAGQHLGRAFGPALAGLVLVSLGASWAFVFNGLSFVLIALIVMSVRVDDPRGSRNPAKPLRHFVEGLSYIRTHPSIRLSVLLAMACGLFANPILQMSIVFGEEVFDVRASFVGVLSGSIGAGALLGTVLLGMFSGRRRSELLKRGMLVFGLGLLAFSFTRIYVLGVLELFIVGAAYLVIASSLQTTVQTQVDEHMRGRALAVYGMGFTLAYALGALGQGWLADQIGPAETVLAAGGSFLAITCWVHVRPRSAYSMDPDVLPQRR